MALEIETTKTDLMTFEATELDALIESIKSHFNSLELEGKKITIFAHAIIIPA
jgi:hypothetical protein